MSGSVKLEQESGGRTSEGLRCFGGKSRVAGHRWEDAADKVGFGDPWWKQVEVQHETAASLKMTVLLFLSKKRERKKRKDFIANMTCCIQIHTFFLYVMDRATYWGGFVSCVSCAEPPAAAQPLTSAPVVVPAGGSGENFQTLEDTPAPTFRLTTCENRRF